MNKLEAYQRCVNEIDDYFEYRYKSQTQEENKEYIQNCMAKLIKRILKSGENYVKVK